MKDVDGMTEVEKYNYIFKEPFGDVTRFKWITNRLLGDIKTFLKGIEYHIITGKTDSSLGGGNLSVPILVTTALEFVSRLYAGDTGLDFSSGYTSKDNVKAFIKFFSLKIQIQREFHKYFGTEYETDSITILFLKHSNIKGNLSKFVFMLKIGESNPRLKKKVVHSGLV